MKIVLEQDGVKRELSAPFHICLGREDLDALIAELMRVQRRWEEISISYGVELIGGSRPQFAPGPAKPWSFK